MAEKIDLLKVLESEFSQAIGAPGGQYAIERAEAMDRYLRKPYGNEEESFSEALTSETADVVDGLMPSLMRLFLTADNLFMFDPVGAEDIPKAEQESEYVNHVFFKENPAFVILFFWMWDALVQKIGVVMAYWDESEEVVTETYKDLTIEEVTEILEEEGVEPVAKDERPLIVNGLPVLDPQTGEELKQYDLQIKKTQMNGRVVIDPVPPEQYRISADANSPLAKGRMEGREFPCSRSDLIKRGFNKAQVNALDAVSYSYTRSEDERARKDKIDDTRGESLDKSQEIIMVRDAYIEVDYDNDGIAELRQVFTAGGDGGKEILKWEDGSLAIDEVDRSPFHTLTPYMLAHKPIGQGVHDKIGEIQDTSTHLLRQVLTNLYHTNNPGHGVSEFGMGENTLDDLLTTKVGRVVRFADNPNTSYREMTVPFTAGASFPMLEFFEKQKRDRTGISSDAEGLSPDALKHVQTTALAQAVDMSKMKQALVVQTFAETGLKSLFLHIHEMLQKHQDKEKVFRLRNEWVPVKPTEWRERMNITANIGLGIGTREQNLIHLNAIKEFQGQIIEAGGMNLLVTPKNIYNTAKEYIKNANMVAHDLYFTDPGDKMAPPVPTEQEKLQKQEQELQQRQQQLDAERQQIQAARHQLDQLKTQLEHMRKLMEMEEKRQKREDDLMIANERLRNDLLELQQNNPKIAAEIQKLVAETDKIRQDAKKSAAESIKVLEEARAQDIENDMVESGVTELLEAPADG